MSTYCITNKEARDDFDESIRPLFFCANRITSDRRAQCVLVEAKDNSFIEFLATVSSEFLPYYEPFSGFLVICDACEGYDSNNSIIELAPKNRVSVNKWFEEAIIWCDPGDLDSVDFLLQCKYPNAKIRRYV